MVYCDGIFYQGYERIGAFGVKPSEARLQNYDIDGYLAIDKTVLDIGGNAGFGPVSSPKKRQPSTRWRSTLT